MSADLPDDRTNNAPIPDLRALDAALRDVLNSAPQVRAPNPPTVGETMDVVSRAATIIDELVERNRSITEAAMRSVEFFRAQANEAQAEAIRLREELRLITERSEAQSVAAEAHAHELETELGVRTASLERAESWIFEIRTQVETMLGDAQARLDTSVNETIFQK